MLLCTIIIVSCVLADQASKLLVLAFLDRSTPTVLINGILRFSYVENKGMAFGLLSDGRWVFMLLSTVGIAAMAVYLYKFAPKSRLLQSALCLAIGGGIGNMIDRVRLGYVIDFIDFYAFPTIWMWVFNIADACVCVGAGLLILYMVLDLIKDYKNKASAQENTEKSDDRA